MLNVRNLVKMNYHLVNEFPGGEAKTVFVVAGGVAAAAVVVVVVVQSVSFISFTLSV